MRQWRMRAGAWLHDFFAHHDGVAVLAALLGFALLGSVVVAISFQEKILASVP